MEEATPMPVDVVVAETVEDRSFTVSLSGYWLFNIVFVLFLGTAKLAMTLHGYSLVPTLLDWFIGVLFAAT